MNLHPRQNRIPHSCEIRDQRRPKDLPCRGIASSRSARREAPGCNLWWYRVIEETRCPLEPSDPGNLRQNLQVPVEVCLDRFPVVFAWPHERVDLARTNCRVSDPACLCSFCRTSRRMCARFPISEALIRLKVLLCDLGSTHISNGKREANGVKATKSVFSATSL